MPCPSKRRKCIAAGSTHSESDSERDLGMVIAHAARKQRRNHTSVEFRRNFHAKSRNLTAVIEETTCLQSQSSYALINILLLNLEASNTISKKTQIKVQARETSHDKLDMARYAQQAIKGARDVHTTCKAFSELLRKLRHPKPYIHWNLDLKSMQELLDTGRIHCLQRATVICDASLASIRNDKSIIEEHAGTKQDHSSWMLLADLTTIAEDDQWCKLARKLVRSVKQLGVSVL